MKILKADYIITCNDNFDIIENGALCFDETIIEVGKGKDIANKYPEAELIWAGENSVLMPGLINSHVHLEFSANKTSLKYGDFISWLTSVIKNRDEILHNSNEKCIEKELENMLKSGTTAIGEISSFGDDFDACIKTPQKVVYFTEILGSRADTVDILFNDFQSKLLRSEDYRSRTFIPAVSIHSPYSTHPILAKHALDIAREKNYLVSTHFMESKAERDWLDTGNGDFIKFFNKFTSDAKPLTKGLDYLELFHDTKTLFTHCTKATRQEIEMIQNMDSFITHCPISNRLLNSGRLGIENIENTMLNLGTDGLSSNFSLNLWDEMRAALMVHCFGDLGELSRLLLKMCTTNAANALGLNNGTLLKGKDADIIALRLPSKLESKEDLCTQLILHTKYVDAIYIDGKEIE